MLLIFILSCCAIVCRSQEGFDPTTHENWHLLKNRNCDGQPTSRIVAGENAAIGELPWVARIELPLSNKDDSAVLICAGTILHIRTILTAARCIIHMRLGAYANRVKILLGENDKTKDPDCDTAHNICAPPFQTIHPREIVYHSQYLSLEHSNDLALIRLEKDIEFNSYVWPICMLQGSLLSSSFLGEEATAAGWGVTDASAKLTSSGSDTLSKVTLKVLDHDVCDNKTVKDDDFNPTYQMCVGGVKDGSGPCFGDWGAPLSIKRDVKTYLIGIFSFNGFDAEENCGDRKDPSVFIRTSAYQKWILDNLVENKENAQAVRFWSL